jgi:hypothetical protein
MSLVGCDRFDRALASVKAKVGAALGLPPEPLLDGRGEAVCLFTQRCCADRVVEGLFDGVGPAAFGGYNIALKLARRDR